MPKGQYTLSPTAQMARILSQEIYKNLRLYKELTGKPFNMGAIQGSKRGPKPGQKAQKTAKGSQ